MVCAVSALRLRWFAGLLVSFAALAVEANTLWRDVDDALTQTQTNATGQASWLMAPCSRVLEGDFAGIRSALDEARPGVPVPFRLPRPDGAWDECQVEPSLALHPDLAARYPEIRTFQGVAVRDPLKRVRLECAPSGFHAQVISGAMNYSIDPLWKGDTRVYACYEPVLAAASTRNGMCLTTSASGNESAVGKHMAERPPGRVLRTYRLAVAAQAEYTAHHGGTIEGALGAIAITVNRINGIYESELAIRLVLVPNNDLLIYTNAQTDPFSSNRSSPESLADNQAALDSVVGNENYDVGQVFHTGEYGLAYIRAVCVPDLKARASVGLLAPGLDPFNVTLVAHELGHQFGANHTFNSASGICGEHRNPGTAYEPGAGTTLMGYSGLPCGDDVLQPISDPFFHSQSLDEIVRFVSLDVGGACGDWEPLTNRPPIVEAGPDYVIPSNTPFALTASGTDPDGHALSYSWEQFDLGPEGSLSEPNLAEGPLFRVFPPSSSLTRNFPGLSRLIAGYTNANANANDSASGEVLPTQSRTLRFRVVVRDQGAGGGLIGMDDCILSVHGEAGPFEVLQPIGQSVARDGLDIAWSVAGTDLDPIRTQSVRILLSTNGGLHFPVVLAEATPNDGREFVPLPGMSTSLARIKVEAVGNVFFAISPGNFSIETETGSPGSPVIQSIAIVDGQVEIVWGSKPGRVYRVQFNSSLSPDTWEDVEGEVTATGESATKSDPKAPNEQRFYRIVEH